MECDLVDVKVLDLNVNKNVISTQTEVWTGTREVTRAIPRYEFISKPSSSTKQILTFGFPLFFFSINSKRTELVASTTKIITALCHLYPTSDVGKV